MLNAQFIEVLQICINEFAYLVVGMLALKGNDNDLR